jgi:hypothetical protein
MSPHWDMSPEAYPNHTNVMTGGDIENENKWRKKWNEMVQGPCAHLQLHERHRL